MKKMIFWIFMILCVCQGISAYAEDSGYLIKFFSGYIPPAYCNLEVISESCGLYFSESRVFDDEISSHIEAVSPNYEIKMPEYEIEENINLLPSLATSDTYFSKQWSFGVINAEYAFNLETYGNEVKIAVIDSGCSDHADLRANVLKGENYYVTVGNGTDKYKDLAADDVTDNIGHGTHVSGIIAAVMNNGIGITGTAPKAKIVPLKCFEDEETTTLMMLAEAICDAVDVYDCRVINMSWTSPHDTDLMKAVIDYAYSKGAILVAAAGNFYNSKVYYPAGYSNVIGVASVESNLTHSDFSNYNTSVTVAAPGRKIYSTYTGGYETVSGTSQATPMVSALAAVAISAKPDITNDEFTQLLISTSTDLGSKGYDVYFGYGLINTEAFLSKLLQGYDGYISPVNYSNGKASVLIKNTADTKMSYLSGFATYSKDGTRMTSCNVEPYVLLPGETAKLTHTQTNDDEKIYFWKSGSLEPLWYRR